MILVGILTIIAAFAMYGELKEKTGCGCLSAILVFLFGAVILLRHVG